MKSFASTGIDLAKFAPPSTIAVNTSTKRKCSNEQENGQDYTSDELSILGKDNDGKEKRKKLHSRSSSDDSDEGSSPKRPRKKRHVFSIESYDDDTSDDD